MSVCVCVPPWASNDVLFPVSEQISVLELTWALCWIYEVRRVSVCLHAVSDLLRRAS